MSFGGGKDQYILEYLVKVTNQGGAGGFNQINTGIKQMDQATKQATFSQEKLAAAQNKVSQAQMGVSKAMKGMAFGFLGITTAGAEMVGMLSMYQQTQEGVKEAQEAANAALKEGGKDSKEYKDAMQDVAKANRWASMTFRNMMLSIFDMIPFIILTINGFVKEKRAATELGKAKQELKVITDGLSKSNIGLAASNKAVDASYLGVSKGAKGVGTATKAAAAAGIVPLTGALSNMGVATVNTEKKVGRLAMASSRLKGPLVAAGAAVSSFSKKIFPIIAIIGSIVVAVEAWKNNWGGFGDVVNQIGVKIGNIHPILKTTMELFAKIGLSIDALLHGNFDELKRIWSSAPKDGPIKTMTKAEEKAAEEWAKLVEDVQSRSLELMNTVAQMDHKERGSWLKSLGFKGSAKKELQDVYDGLDKVQDAFTGLGNTLQTMAQIDILDDKYGLKIDKDKFRKALYTLEDRISEAAKDTFKKKGLGRKLLDGLSEALHKDAKSKNPENAKYTAEYLIQHPEVIDLAKKSGVPQEIIDILTVKYQQALEKQKQKLQAKRSKMLSKMSEEEKLAFQTSGGFMTDAEKDKWWDDQFKEPGDTKLNEMFENFKVSVTNGLNKLKEAITGADWAGMGATFREKVASILTPTNVNYWGSQINALVIAPFVQAANGVFGTFIAGMAKDPVGFLVGTVNAVTFNIGQLVAGLFGFTGDNAEQQMFDSWKLEFQKLFSSNKSLVWLRDLINNPVKAIQDAIFGGKGIHGGDSGETTGSQANEEAGLEGNGVASVGAQITNWINEIFIVPIQEALSTAWNTLSTFLGGMGWLDKLFKGDWYGAITELMGNIKEVTTPGTAKNKAATVTAEQLYTDIGLRNVVEGFGEVYDTVTTNFEDTYQDLALMIADPEAWVRKWAETHAKIVDKGTGTAGIIGGTPTTDQPKGKDWAGDIKKGIESLFSTYDNQAFGAEVNVQLIPNIVTDYSWQNPGEAANMYGGGVTGGKKGDEQIGSLLDQWWKQTWGSWTPTGGPQSDSKGGWGGPTWWKDGSILRLSIPVAPEFQLTNISQNQDNPQDSTTVFDQLIGSAATAQVTIAALFSALAKSVIESLGSIMINWTSITVTMPEDARFGMEGILEAWEEGFNAIGETFDAMGELWSEHMNAFGENAKSGMEQLLDAWSEGFDAIGQTFEAMDELWADVVNHMIRLAADAVDDILNEMQRLETTFVTIHEIRTIHTGSAAKGGIISAAQGKMMTTYGPRMLMIGDNPGGRETLVAIPHDNPGPTLAKIAGMFGDQSGSSFSTLNTTGTSRGSNKGLRVDIHNHLLERDVLNIINIDKGRMISKYNR